jgi:hypothetical protein
VEYHGKHGLNGPVSWWPERSYRFEVLHAENASNEGFTSANFGGANVGNGFFQVAYTTGSSSDRHGQAELVLTTAADLTYIGQPQALAHDLAHRPTGADQLRRTRYLCLGSRGIGQPRPVWGKRMPLTRSRLWPVLAHRALPIQATATSAII